MLVLNYADDLISAYSAHYRNLLSLALVSEHHVAASQRQNEMLQFSSSHPRD